MSPRPADAVGWRRLDDLDDLDEGLERATIDRASERVSWRVVRSQTARATSSFAPRLDRSTATSTRRRDREKGELGIGAFIHSLTRRFIDSIRLDRDGAVNEGEDDDDVLAPREIERDVDVGERDDERDGDRGRDGGAGGRRARVLVATGGTGVETSGEETRDRGVGKDEE